MVVRNNAYNSPCSHNSICYNCNNVEDIADSIFVCDDDVIRCIPDKRKLTNRFCFNGSNDMTWYWVSMSYATFGIAIDDSNFKVVKTAPIAKWMIGKDISYIQNWIKNKGGVWKELKKI